MGYPRHTLLMLPVTRLELPGWGRLFSLLKVNAIESYPRWRSAPRKTIRGKWHGYMMNLDLSDWSQRHTYFLGRYFALGLQLCLDAVLRADDRFVDVGANIGMVTLHAAARVGPAGCVESFEPNPMCQARLTEHLEMNRIEHVRVHPVALSDQDGSMTLQVLTEHSGMGTLADVPDEECHLVTRRHEVAVRVGDELLLENPQPIVMLKIDVEGLETRVVRGLRRTLDRWRPLVVSELVADHLHRAASSPTELVAEMEAMKYRGFRVLTRRRGLSHRLVLAPLSPVSDEVEDTDVLWVHPDSPAAARVKPFMMTTGRDQSDSMRSCGMFAQSGATGGSSASVHAVGSCTGGQAASGTRKTDATVQTFHDLA